MEPSRTDLPAPSGLAPVPLRVAAYVVDVALLALFAQATQWPLHALLPTPVPHGWPLYLVTVATLSLPVWLYFGFFESRAAGATPGKRLLRLHVVREEGTRLSFGAALLRGFVKVLPWEVLHATILLPRPLQPGDPGDLMRPGFTISMLLLGSWFATAILTTKQQSVHDLVVGSIVRRGRAPGTV